MASTLVRSVTVSALLGGFLLMPACGGDGGTEPNQDPSVQIQQPADGATFTQGAAITFQGSAGDAEDGSLTGSDLVWTSDIAGQLGTGATITVSTLAAGTHEIVLTATDSEGARGADTVNITVTPPEGAPEISSVSPATIQDGTTATITGENFSPTASQNVVTVGGIRVPVITAGGTQLELDIPDPLCLPAGEVEVVVTVSGESSAPRTVTFQPTSTVSLAQGEHAVLQDPSALCLRFPAASTDQRYLIGVQSTSNSVTSLTATELTVQAAPATGLSQAVSATPTGGSATRAGTGGLRPQDLLGASELRRREHREAELRIRRWERENLEPLLPVGRQLRPEVSRQQEVALIPANLAVGQTVEVRVPDLELGFNLCSNYVSVDAVVRLIGQNSVWLEDVANPPGGFAQSDYQALSDDFDDVIYDTDVAWFGQPTDLDSNGVIAVLYTKEVNETEGLLGFVFSGDLFPREDCDQSNEGEIYYGKAPDVNGTFGLPYSVSDALEDGPFLIAHEFAHIIQFGRRVENPNAQSFLTSWEAEGQATLAEEVNGYRFAGHGSEQNLGFDVAFGAFPNDPLPSVEWYSNAFVDMALYFGFGGRDANDDPIEVQGAPHECSWVGREDQGNTGPCIGSRQVYGVPWSIFRWISDHHGDSYPGGPQGIMRDLIDNDVSGFENVREVLGIPMRDLLAEWAPMLYVDDRANIASPLNSRLTYPSWNLYNIFDENLVEEATLNPIQLSWQDTESVVSVRAGSSAYYEISGSSRPATAVHVTDPSGNPLPSIMQVWVVRLQ